MSGITGATSVTSESATSLNKDLLLQEFALQANLLGADIVETDIDGLAPLMSAEIQSRARSVGVSSDLAGLFPELDGIESGTDEPVDVALSRGRLGVSFSGSVLIAESTHEDRVLPMLCRRHVVVLPADRIVRHMMDAGAAVRELMSVGYRYLTFVSGPSRTADIEKILTIGAHGPAELKIIVVHGWEPRDDVAKDLDRVPGATQLWAQK